MTSLQIARATDAERAEARSLSADRRRKLRLDLGDSEGVSTLLENSLLGAEGTLSVPVSPLAPILHACRRLLVTLYFAPCLHPTDAMQAA